MSKLLVFTILLIVVGCAGPNPNPGERTTDLAWTSNDFQRAFDTAKPMAEAGYPWAQLRVAIFYDNGWGTEKDINQAEYWYKQAAAQKSDDSWAEGVMVGTMGKSGYFNQNGDARIAQLNLARLYYKNNIKLQEAYTLISTVISETNGKPIFFCCEFMGGRSFSHEELVALKNDIETKIGKYQSHNKRL